MNAAEVVGRSLRDAGQGRERAADELGWGFVQLPLVKLDPRVYAHLVTRATSRVVRVLASRGMPLGTFLSRPNSFFMSV